MRNGFRFSTAPLLALALMASGCATSLPAMPIVEAPKHPPPPAALMIEPDDSPSWLEKLTDWRKTVRERLTDTPDR